MTNLRSIDTDSKGTPSDYDPMKVRNDCRNTAIYCVISVGLLIAASTISNPAVADMLPGGPVTVLILGILIIISILALCYWQRPCGRR